MANLSIWFKGILGAILLSALGVTAHAQQTDASRQPLSLKDRNLEIRLGALWINFNEAVKVKVGGNRLGNTDLKIDDNVTLLTELTWFMDPYWSIAFTSGIPPKTDVWGKRSLKPLGKLTSTTYGPIAASLRKHFYLENGMSPYVGAGVVYAIFFNSMNSKYLKNVEIDNHFGTVISAGIDVPVTDKLTAFIDVKQMFLPTDLHFDLVTPAGNIPGKADVRLNPMLATVGLSLRF